MKKWIVLLALLAFELLPSQGTELGEIHPISLLAVDMEGKNICLSTDTMDTGVGETLDAALANLEDTTPGHLFLDTAENLVVTEQSRFLIPELEAVLRPGVMVCMTDTEIDLNTASEFLHQHIPRYRLSETDETTPLQMLTYSEERYFLEK